MTHIENYEGGYDLIETGDADWEVGSLEVTMGGFKEPTGGGYEIDICFGYQDSSHLWSIMFYAWESDSYTRKIQIFQLKDGHEYTWDEASFYLEVETDYAIRILLLPYTIVAYIDGTEVLSKGVSELIQGKVVFSASASESINFDDVKVYKQSDNTNQKTKLIRVRNQLKNNLRVKNSRKVLDH
ncbi:hypothetical protein ACFL27_22405 [candidate division CSSED10-310 bacterium]|uniref:Uncharacterized protein n=1 Tax=candidate division CSSED10-310 bacterium TaxID=2855610 RepID=A0ABV6Z3E9_UNCC1